MDFSLMHAGLAAGATLAALPLILHLFMRQTPKKVVFPALRLIRERQKRSKKKLRVKNWLLLLARMALVALMALALARPSITSEASVGDQDVPAALGLVFDTSLSMGYTERDKSRLDEAKTLAADILARTPGSSLVFVVDSSEPGVPPALSPAAARKRIDALTLRPASRPLNVAVGQAYTAVAEAERPIHEVYVLTDLARSAWDIDRPAEGLDKAAKLKAGIKTYVLRLTPADVHDAAVVAAAPSTEVAIEGEPFEVVARVRATGAAASRIAELWVDGVARGKSPVEVPANSEVDVRFNVSRVDPNTKIHQGEVRLKGAPDPLPFDDVRYFTFTVKPPTRVLVVSDKGVDSLFVADAIDPDPATLPKGTPRPYRVERVLTPALLEKPENLSQNYRCIFLNDVAELSDAEWGKLSGFVSEGGGLVVGLGSKVRPEKYGVDTASQVMPAALDRVSEARETSFFGRVTDYTHPLFQKYPKELDAMLTETPVSRHWVVKPREGSRVLLAYADKSPALVERVFKGTKTGRVLLWTTPLSRPADSNARDAWGDWPVVGWSFFHLMNQTVAYMAGATEQATAFEAGRDVLIPLDPTRRAKNYTVVGPEKKTSDRLSPPAGTDSLLVVAPQQLGQWTVQPSADAPGAESFGFSVNAPLTETQFVRR